MKHRHDVDATAETVENNLPCQRTSHHTTYTLKFPWVWKFAIIFLSVKHFLLKVFHWRCISFSGLPGIISKGAFKPVDMRSHNMADWWVIQSVCEPISVCASVPAAVSSLEWKVFNYKQTHFSNRGAIYVLFWVNYGISNSYPLDLITVNFFQRSLWKEKNHRVACT